MFIAIFGTGKELTILQMSCRGVVIFIIAFILVRISGRRSFGMKAPLDNIIVILLGAILSRAVVGASPFLPVVITSLLIVLLHRALGWLNIHNKHLEQLLEGKKIILFEKTAFQEKNMGKALACKEDVMQGVRRTALTDDLSMVEKVYMERNGEISVIKKQHSHSTE